MGRLQGKIAVVSGAGGRTGRASAILLAKEGASVIGTDIDPASCEHTAKLIRDAGGEALARQHDVTDEKAWEELYDLVIDKYGHLDILVNCASVCILKPIRDMTLEEFQHQNRVNAEGTFMGARGAVLAMRRCADEGETPRGSIVNVSSIGAQIGIDRGVGLCASAGAVKNMCKTMGVECGDNRDEIRINSVHAGPLLDQDELAHAIGADRRVSAEDVAQAVVYLASAEARLVTGSDITVDAGLSLGIPG